MNEKTWREVAFHDVSEDAILAALPRLAERQSTQPFLAPVNLTAARFGSVPKTFLRTSLDKMMTPALQDRMLGSWHVEKTHVLESGHFPTLSVPEELAEVMLAEA